MQEQRSDTPPLLAMGILEIIPCPFHLRPMFFAAHLNRDHIKVSRSRALGSGNPHSIATGCSCTLRCMLHEAPCTFRHKRRLSRSPPLRCPHNNGRCAALALLPTCTVVDSVPSHQLGRHMHEMSVSSSERNAKTSAHNSLDRLCS